MTTKNPRLVRTYYVCILTNATHKLYARVTSYLQSRIYSAE